MWVWVWVWVCARVCVVCVRVPAPTREQGMCCRSTPSQCLEPAQQSALREVEQHTDTHRARLTSRRREHDSQTSESPRPRAIVKQCTVTWEEVEGSGRHESVERAAKSSLQRTHEHTHSDRSSPHTHKHTHTPCIQTHTHTLTHAHRHQHTRLLSGPERTCLGDTPVSCAAAML